MLSWLGLGLLLAAVDPFAIPPAAAPANPPGQAPGTFRPGMAALETGAILGLEIGWYEWQIELNKADFDFARTYAGQSRRWSRLHGLRFDDNSFGINMGHAYYNGSFYYDIARVLGGSIWQSWLFTLATSSVWEATIEHREVFSLNDTIVTPAGGAAIGEPFFQLGTFFARGAPNLPNKILTLLFSPAQTLNNAVGVTTTARAPDVDRFGLPTDTDHRLLLMAGGGASTRGEPGRDLRPEYQLAFEADLVNVRTRGREASVSRNLSSGEFSRVRALYAANADGMTDLRAYTQASLWGHYWQRTARGADGLFGHSLFLGVGTAFDLSVGQTAGHDDYFGIMHVAGPSADSRLYLGPLDIHARLEVFGDFAMSRSLAFQALQALQVYVADTKSVLLTNGYYYGWGFTGVGALEVQWRGLRLSTEWQWNWFDSWEGRDRHQQAFTSPTGYFHDAVTNDFNLRDQRRILSTRLSWQPVTATFLSPVMVFAGHESLVRISEASAERVRRQDDRVSAGLSGVF